MSVHQHPSYITDVDYPRHFHRETMPVWLTATATALGLSAPDLTRPYRWLELGCGSGLNAVIAAIGNPLGHFIGVDINARAIEQAQQLADIAGIRNIEFHALSFESMLDAYHSPADVTNLADYDFVISHGVYSWIAPEQRAVMRQLIAERLKPGGLLYTSYMSHPGSSSFAAAQRLMQLSTRAAAGDSASKARAAAELMQRLVQTGAGYFQDHPLAVREVQNMARTDAHYLAHEYLNPHWDALHVSDVVSDFSSAGLDYIGSATLLENIDSISLPAATQALLAEMQHAGADVAQIETFKDIARNQTQRRDLYKRCGTQDFRLPAEAHRAALLAQRVCLTPAAPVGHLTSGGTLTLDTRIGPVELPMEHAAPLLNALQSGPLSYGQIARLPAYRQRPGFISQLLQTLAWTGWLQFLRPDLGAHGQATPSTLAMNHALAGPYASFHGPLWLAPASGGAVPVLNLALNTETRSRLGWLGIELP